MSQQTAKAARQALTQAIDREALARGEAQWMNGYRASYCGGRTGSTAEERSLFKKELAQWTLCDNAEKRTKRAISAYARAVRREAKK